MPSEFRLPNKICCKVENIGYFKKLDDMTAVAGVKPARLNEDRRLYGRLGHNKLDLKLGTEGFVDEGGGDKFQSIFDYLKKTNLKGSVLEEIIDADFFSNRRIIQQFAMAGHRYPDGMEIKAVRKNGVIFLCDTTEFQGYWNGVPCPYGYKFEQCMTLDENGEPHDKYAKVSNAECTKGVFRTTLLSENQEIKLFYAAELDAMDSNGKLVEMKTTAQPLLKWLKFKSLKDYTQSYFGNIDSILYGYKTSDEVVIEVERIPLKNIPNIVSENLGQRKNLEPFIWNFDKCLGMLFSILEGIKSRLEFDDDAITVKISSKTGVSYEALNEAECTFVDPLFLRHFD